MDKNVIPELDRMGLAQALIYLYKLRAYLPDDSDLSRALDSVLRFHDEIWMIQRIIDEEKRRSYENI